MDTAGLEWNNNYVVCVRTHPKSPTETRPRRFRVRYWKLLLLSATMAAYSASAAPTLTGTDLGSPSNPGSVKTAADGKITVVGGGSDIWNTSDNFHYAYFKVTGDFDYVVKVESLTGQRRRRRLGQGRTDGSPRRSRFPGSRSPRLAIRPCRT